MAVKATYLLMAGGGAILLWSGLKGHRWTTTLRDVISGRAIPSTKELAITSSSAAFSSSSVGPQATTAIGGSVAKNKAIAKLLAAGYGWSTGAQWDALDWLWSEESSWNNKAKNPTSAAYGIPQANPGSKMGALANPPISSASAQIAWGLKYIKDVYHTPVQAKIFHLANGWY